MTWGAFILYALPSLVMALSGYFIPKIDMDISFKLLSFVLITMLTLVFSHYFTIFLKKVEVQLFCTLEENVEKLKQKVTQLEKDIERKELEHARGLAEINNKINGHLKNNPKSNAENLWDEINSMNDELFSDFRNKMPS